MIRLKVIRLMNIRIMADNLRLSGTGKTIIRYRQKGPASSPLCHHFIANRYQSWLADSHALLLIAADYQRQSPAI